MCPTHAGGKEKAGDEKEGKIPPGVFRLNWSYNMTVGLDYLV